MIQKYRILRKRKPELHGHKIKRTGSIYYEVAYFTDFWRYKEFKTPKEVKEFLSA